MSKYIICLFFLSCSLSALTQRSTETGNREMNDRIFNFIRPVGDHYICLSSEDIDHVSDPGVKRRMSSKGFSEEIFLELKDKHYITLLSPRLEYKDEIRLPIRNADYLTVFSMISSEKGVRMYYAKRKQNVDEINYCVLDIFPNELSKSKEIILDRYRYEDDVPDTHFKINMDSTKFLYVTEPFLRDNQVQKLVLTVVDNDNNLEWNKLESFKRRKNQIDFQDIELDTAGMVYIAYDDYNRNTGRPYNNEKRGTIRPDYLSFIMCTKGKKIRKTLELGYYDAFITHIDISYNLRLDELSVAGIYKNKHNGNYSGVFNTTISSNSLMLGDVFETDFDKKLLISLDEDGIAKTSNKDPGLRRRLDFDTDLLVKEDGNISYLIQPIELERSNNFNNNAFGPGVGFGGFNRFNRFNTFDIDEGFNSFSMIMVELREQTKFIRIPKNIDLRTDYSFVIAKPFVIQNDIYILYADKEENLNRRLKEKPDRLRRRNNAALVSCRIDPDGFMSRKLVTEEEDNLLIYPGTIERIDFTRFLVNAEERRFFNSNFQFIILTESDL